MRRHPFLITFVVVSLLFGALTALLLPTLFGQAERARSSRARSDVANIGKSLARLRSEGSSNEAYAPIEQNRPVATETQNLSTFAIDVDTASYALSRRKLLEGAWPNPDGVRVEEFLNYFQYDYPVPEGDPWAVHLDAAPSPFNPSKVLLRVGLQAKKIRTSQRKPVNLTFLVDVSGSMAEEDRLPLAKQALHLLVDNLNEADTVGIVTYAGDVRLVLEQTSTARKVRIHDAIESLSSGGSTAMGDGLALAYRIAGRTLRPGAESRVIVLSDGDANVGPVSQEELQRIIAGQAAEGVTLSVVGFGVGNYKDARMEALADKGNGNYSYVDSMRQAKRLFQDQIAGTLEVLAKDMKVQVEFDPRVVKSFRQVGYENRALANSDFRVDSVDAGELGPGHSVTALYELDVAPRARGPLATVRVRAKEPRGTQAIERTWSLDSSRQLKHFDEAPAGFRFAVAVMGFADVLRHAPGAGLPRLGEVQRITRGLELDDDRREFVTLVGQAQRLCSEHPQTCGESEAGFVQ